MTGAAVVLTAVRDLSELDTMGIYIVLYFQIGSFTSIQSTEKQFAYAYAKSGPRALLTLKPNTERQTT